MKTPTAPLSRSVDKDVLDWEGVERAVPHGGRDVLGLGPEDRAALGMSQARALDIAPATNGDAGAALAELLQRGVAIGKTEKRRR